MFVLLALTVLLPACNRDLVAPQGQAKPDLKPTRPSPVAVYEKMFKTFGRAARSHQLADLVPFVSKRMRADLVQTLRKHRQRFWNHIDRIIRGIQSGLTVQTPVRRPDGRLDLPLRFDNGDSLSPIIIFEDGKPKIDRF